MGVYSKFMNVKNYFCFVFKSIDLFRYDLYFDKWNDEILGRVKAKCVWLMEILFITYINKIYFFSELSDNNNFELGISIRI